MRFLGAAENGQRCEHSSENIPEGGSDSVRHLVIGEEAFSDCKNLRQVVFDSGSAVEEIQQMAFRRSGLESFTAPPSLRKIGIMTFRECCNLKRF